MSEQPKYRFRIPWRLPAVDEPAGNAFVILGAWQSDLLLTAVTFLGALVKIHAMRGANETRRARGAADAYGEEAFYEIADSSEELLDVIERAVGAQEAP